MDPLEFEPLLKRIRWGGRRLGTALGKPLGDGDDYAESWELADHGHDQSVVARGAFAGWTLSRLVRERSEELLGRHARAGVEQFPLLVKFLDAQDRLSVQVHPNDEQAKRYAPDENGKTEAWVILEAAPHSRIYAGLKPGVNAESLRAHLAAGTVVECLHSFHPRPGDCVFIPAGTVHALGEGILLAEVQQSSDVTFRLFDWDRLDRDGHPRPLHIEESLAVIDFARGPVDPAQPEILVEEPGRRCERLARCEHFELRRHTISRPLAVSRRNDFSILIALAGHADWCWNDERHPFPRGQTMLIPASSPDVRIEPRGEVTLLEALLP
ncbi:MAG: type I phosphomannose isomerase catalytic subunit [Planctomycetales bacterium]